MACKNCGREHEPVRVMDWMLHVHNGAYKPPGSKGLAIVYAFALTLNLATGCGYASQATVGKKGRAGERATRDVLQWATDKETGLAERLVRGHNIDGETKTASFYRLLPVKADPKTQPADSDGLGQGQPASSDGLGGGPNRRIPTTQPASSDDPTRPNSPPSYSPVVPSPDTPGPAASGGASGLTPTADDLAKITAAARDHLGRDITADDAQRLADGVRPGGGYTSSVSGFVISKMRANRGRCLRILDGEDGGENGTFDQPPASQCARCGGPGWFGHDCTPPETQEGLDQ